MIPVTKPFLPSKEAYQAYVDSIWERQWLTNNGPLLNEYELQLKRALNVNHLLYVANGTIALQVAIKALDIEGDVITTPFSYVATTSSAVWEGCRPIFVDVDPSTLNIDPAKIEAAVTAETKAIIATHCFGNSCDIDAIQTIADQHGLKVIYDAAHCFGTQYKGKSVFEYGDISILSLHATKLIHSVEGGAVFTKSPELLKKMSYLRNFGHNGPEAFHGLGINGKNSEFHAAMGLAVLKHRNEILENRAALSAYYDKALRNLEVDHLSIDANCTFNYAYYPILFKDEARLLASKEALERQGIFARRYFYPALSQLPYVDQQEMPIAESISERILCLPLYYGLRKEEQDLIVRILLRTQNYG